jgi:hypothetical protein
LRWNAEDCLNSNVQLPQGNGAMDSVPYSNDYNANNYAWPSSSHELLGGTLRIPLTGNDNYGPQDWSVEASHLQLHVTGDQATNQAPRSKVKHAKFGPSAPSIERTVLHAGRSPNIRMTLWRHGHGTTAHGTR